MSPSITIPDELKGKTPAELALALGVSRQYAYNLIRKEAGMCIRCGKTPVALGTRCLKCAKAVRKQEQKRTGSKPWKAGKPGRPPLDRKES